MSYLPTVLRTFNRLLSYPDDHVGEAAEFLYVVLKDEIPEGASEAARFGAFLESHEPWELEEIFTRTFDVNPVCALEVGWHLFGEEYARGMFLVRMRQELRKYGLTESTELPDHISHVLEVVAAMPEDEASRFVQACVQPAVETINRALQQKETPYRHVTACLAKVLEQRWGPGKADDRSKVLASGRPETDPLRAFPVADVGCNSGCHGSCETHAEAEFVPLETGKLSAGHQDAAPHSHPEMDP